MKNFILRSEEMGDQRNPLLTETITREGGNLSDFSNVIEKFVEENGQKPIET
jgi:hypothetical protein